MLFPSGGQTPLFRQLLVAADVNRDGHRELAVVATGPDSPGEWNQMALHVDGLSGKDGTRLVRWKHDKVGGFIPDSEQFGGTSNFLGTKVLVAPAEDKLGGAGWWVRNSRGWPDVMVPITRKRFGHRDETRLVVVSLEQQRATEKLLDVNAAYSAELTGDGLVDLWYRHHGVDGDRLHALGGTAPERWRRPGGAIPIHDCNGDGVGDLLETRPPGALINPRTRIYSGRDGQIIRRIHTQTSFTNQALLPPNGDLDGGGIPDVLFHCSQNRHLEMAPRLTDSMEIPFGVVSVETGNRLWETPLFKVPPSILQAVKSAKSSLFAYDLLGAAVDLNPDHQAEVLCCFQLQWGFHDDSFAQYWTALVSGAKGRIEWAVPLSDAPYHTTPLDRQARPRLLSSDIDIDSDGDRDWIVIVPRFADSEVCTAEIQARSGRDGNVLWSYRLPTRLDRANTGNFLETFPLPVVGDLDADHVPEIVTIVRSAAETAASVPKYVFLILSIDGTVKTQDAWTGSPGQSTTPSPVLADLDGTGHRSIVIVGQYAEPQTGLTVIGADGRMAWQVPAVVSQSVTELLPVADLQGDGRDELIAWDHQILRVFTGGQNELWTWTSPFEPSMAPARIQLVPANGGNQRSLVVQVGSQFFELDGADGKVLRRGGGLPRNPPHAARHFWLPATSSEAFPIIISHGHSLVALEVLPIP